MTQKRVSTYFQNNQSSVENHNLNNTIHNVFWLLTLIASYTPDKSIVYLSFHRVTSISQQEGIHIIPTRFYQAIDKMIDTNIIIPTEFKYRYRLNPVFFSFIKNKKEKDIKSQELSPL
ncbi:hypothetical protein DJ485_12370 [Citrobacter freundii]|nr:hypothetical protein [Escherichia coli]PWM14243.1 MAG: hypothetical protein DBX97_23375 [Collinsella tanakaei]THE52710.1 hypothetical protein DJ485_12370 [Citrobacter freundii]TYD04033.1 hypothetical protein E4M14_014380 [Enterobacter sp. Z1]EFF1409741.1 hypothetical protein [Escherichia coli]